MDVPIQGLTQNTTVPTHLSFNVLGRRSFTSPPETDAANGGESEENAVMCQLTVHTWENDGDCLPKCNTQSPNGLHFEASGFGRTNPIVVIQHPPGLV